MIELKLDGNPFDPEQSIARLLKRVLAELKATGRPSCLVRMDLLEQHQVTVRITPIQSKQTGAPRRKRRPSMAHTETRK